MTDQTISPAALPSSRTLIRSTVIAVCVATAILLGAVLPAEYGIDPTGVGRVLGLTQMGKLKLELAKEAEADAAKVVAASSPSSLTGPVGSTKTDSMIVTLGAGESIEVKLAMLKGQRAEYTWQTDSGSIYYDLHAETLKLPRTAPHRYSEGKLHGAQGEIVAEFDGVHGWYWNNESDRAVRIVVKAWGQFQNMIEM